MKLRLRGNSVRIRLTQSEVRELDRQGSWEDVTVFGPTAMHRLVHRVESKSVALPVVSLSVAGSETMVKATLPQAQVSAWANGADIGIYFEEPWGLKVAVEKDFRCLDEDRGEDESDNFDNPNAADSLHAVCHAE